MDKINFSFIDVEIPDFNPEFFGLWLSHVLKDYDKVCGELEYVFCSDEYLLEINKEHLDHDYYTDIITFDYNNGDTVSGDLFVSYDRVKSNAAEFGNGSIEDELCRVMVHGLLHLIGFNDKTKKDQELMRQEETKNLIKR